MIDIRIRRDLGISAMDAEARFIIHGGAAVCLNGHPFRESVRIQFGECLGFKMVAICAVAALFAVLLAGGLGGGAPFAHFVPRGRKSLAFKMVAIRAFAAL